MARKQKPRRVVRSLPLLVACGVIAGLLGAAAMLPYLGIAGLAAKKTSTGFQSLANNIQMPPLPEQSKIVDAQGNTLATFFAQNRISVPLNQVAPVMVQALLAVEDSRFYEHGGI